MPDQNSDLSRPADPQAVPEPQRPDVPRYGEYAAPAPANPYGVPGYPAGTVPVPPAAPGVPGAYAPPPRKRRTWDVVLTSILLVLGLFGMGAGLVYAAIFADPGLLDQTMKTSGLGGFSGNAGSGPAVLVISHVVLYLLALGLSIPLLIRGKIVVFWIPLTIGVVAAIIFWSVGISVFLSDPNFINNVH